MTGKDASAASSVIAIDAMGGDHGPGAVIDGVARVLRKHPGQEFLLFGDEATLSPIFARRKILEPRCTIRHAPDAVTMDDKPAWAIRQRRESSMWLALQAVADGEASVAVSPGNTGALLAMSILILRKAHGVDRPAIAVHWPSFAPHAYNTVLDMGADIRADARNLTQFAVMGAAYARLSFDLDRPRVGLLNVGSEETKGPEALHHAADLIREAAAKPGARFEFVGFIEGNDIPGTKADVVVTDGFTGNIALKTAEGTASLIRDGLKAAFRHSWMSRFASLFAVSSLKRLTRRIDPRRVNGGVFLGLNGSVVKSHGGADAVSFEAALRLAVQMAEANFSADLARQLAKLAVPADDAVTTLEQNDQKRGTGNQ